MRQKSEAEKFGVLFQQVAVAMGLMGIQAHGESPGEPDPAMAVQLRADAVVSSVAIEETGRVVIGGDFWWVNGTRSAGLARLNVNGSIDGSFAPEIGLTLRPGGISGWNSLGGVTVPPTTLLPLPDGRLWVSASSPDNSWTVLSTQGEVSLGALASLPSGLPTRPHAEGLAGGELVISLYASSLAVGEIRGVDLATGAVLWSHTLAGPVQPQRAWPNGEGSWWVAGDDPSVPAGALAGVPGTAKQLWRITSDGRPDATWTAAHLERGLSQVFQPITGGRLAVLAMDFRSLQFNVATTGTLPVTTTLFSGTGGAESTFSSLHSMANAPVAQAAGTERLLSNLGSDPSAVRAFTYDGTPISGFTPVPLPPGNALVSRPGGGFFAGVGRHLGDGAPDPAWTRPAAHRPATVYSLAPAPDRAAYVAGDFADANGTAARCVLRVRPDGSVDPAFRLDPRVVGEVRQIRSLADGRLYALERPASFPTSEARSRVVRLLATGALDADFTPYDGTEPAPNPPGGQTKVGEVQEFSVMADGSLLVRTMRNGAVGLSAHAWRGLMPDGKKDPAFKPIPNPPLSAPLVLPDGTFWLQGTRYLRDGTKDLTLPATVSSLTPPALLSDGKIAFKISQSGVRALEPSGAWDANFFIPLPPGNAVHKMIPDQNGGLILVYDVTGSAIRFIERFDRWGRRDPAFRATHPSLKFAPSESAAEIFGPLGRLPAEANGDAHVSDILVHGGRLWLGGNFTHHEGQRRDGLTLFALEPAVGYEAWATACFRLAPTPLEDRGPENDPDGDGAVNALEYATGTDPTSPDARDSQLRLVSLDPLGYSIARNPNASELLLVVEVSDQLHDWRAATDQDLVLQQDPWAVTLKPLPGPANRYFRVRFIAPP